jgi:hypothetical protein
MPDITVYRGDSFTIEVGPVADTEDPVDLTLANTQMWFTAKRKTAVADADAVIRLGSPTTGLTGITLNLPASDDDNMATITVPVDVTAVLPPARTELVYDVQLLEPSGRKTTVATGNLTVLADVTRA